MRAARQNRLFTSVHMRIASDQPRLSCNQVKSTIRAVPGGDERYALCSRDFAFGHRRFKRGQAVFRAGTKLPQGRKKPHQQEGPAMILRNLVACLSLSAALVPSAAKSLARRAADGGAPN